METNTKISPLQRFYNLLKIDRQEIISIYIYALFYGLVSLSLPLGIQAIINLIGGGMASTSWIILVVFVIAGVAITGILQVLQLSISENIQMKIFTRSAFEFAFRIPRLKMEAVDKHYIPELVNRFFDTLSVQKGLSKILLDFSSASLQIILGLILLSIYHPFFIFFSILLLIILYLIFKFTAPRGLKTSIAESKYKYEVAHWLEEVARTMETFKLAGKSPLPLQKTDEAVENYLQSRKAHFKTLLTQYFNLIGFKVIIAAGLLIMGGLLVINQQMNIGQFVAAEIVIILIIASVEKLILSMETIYDVLTALEKIGYVTDLPLENDQASGIVESSSQGLKVRLSDFSYRFPREREDLLKNVNLHLEPGEKVCLSGPDGSGKSFLLQIIAGLYDTFRGTLSYNGIPLGNWKKAELRSMIGDSLVNEDIFNGSLFENISLGKEGIGLQEAQQLAEVVGLTEFIESLPEGYDTILMPEGRSLPKSVRLKIMLARCLACEPRLVLLEDNFNQLNEDIKTRFLNHVLNSTSTVLAVSNDKKVCDRFDRHLVVEGGTIKKLS